MRFLLLLFSLPILAHTLYFLPVKFGAARGEKLVFSLHNGDSFPASDDAVSPDRLHSVRLVGPRGGEVRIVDFHRLGKATHGMVPVSEPGTHWLVAETKPNLLSLAPAKFEEYLKEEGLEHAVEWRKANGEAAKASRERYTKHAKSLLVCEAPSENWSRTLGLDIEFVLGADPSRMKPGAELPVQVFWNGKPAPGLRVEKAWAAADGAHGTEIVGRTDANGRVAVKLDRAARWRLHTVAIRRLSGDAEADWASDWATVTFELN